MYHLWITYQSERDEYVDGNDFDGEGGDYERRSVTHSYHFFDVYRNSNPGTKFQTFEVEVDKETWESDQVYAVIVRYSDGDTFNDVRGLCCVPHICASREDAEIIEKAINENKYMENQNLYLPWEGYFSGLEGTEVLEFKVS